MFLAYHLFVENCKWNFAGEEGVVPRPWPHTIYIPLIWFFSAAFAVPTIFWSEVRPWNDDFYKNEKLTWRPTDSQVIMPKELCKPHYGNSHLETVVCKWKAPHWGIV